jgi:hypothetical protein
MGYNNFMPTPEVLCPVTDNPCSFGKFCVTQENLLAMLVRSAPDEELAFRSRVDTEKLAESGVLPRLSCTEYRIRAVCEFIEAPETPKAERTIAQRGASRLFDESIPCYEGLPSIDIPDEAS